MDSRAVVGYSAHSAVTKGHRAALGRTKPRWSAGLGAMVVPSFHSPQSARQRLLSFSDGGTGDASLACWEGTIISIVCSSGNTAGYRFESVDNALRSCARDRAADGRRLTRASLGAPSDRFRWGEAKGRAEGSGQVRRIGEARVHGGCPHQFTGSYLARGMLER